MTKLINLATLVAVWLYCSYSAVRVFQSPFILKWRLLIIALLAAIVITATVGIWRENKQINK
jgi:membrane protein DedA with SNARE-associated domain